MEQQKRRVYIDLDKINRLHPKLTAKYPLSFANGISAAISEINRLPKADVVTVVKCKDCVHYREMSGYEHHGIKARNCVWHNALRSENEFCSDGISSATVKDTDTPT